MYAYFYINYYKYDPSNIDANFDRSADYIWVIYCSSYYFIVMNCVLEFYMWNTYRYLG